MKELETVVLTKDIPEYGLKKGDVGTIVMVHAREVGYEVEFVTLGGETIGVLSLKPSEVRLAEKREIPHVRAVA